MYVGGIGTIELHNSFTVTYFTGLAMFGVLTLCYSADKVLRRLHSLNTRNDFLLHEPLHLPLWEHVDVIGAVSKMPIRKGF